MKWKEISRPNRENSSHEKDSALSPYCRFLPPKPKEEKIKWIQTNKRDKQTNKKILCFGQRNAKKEISQ